MRRKTCAGSLHARARNFGTDGPRGRRPERGRELGKFHPKSKPCQSDNNIRTAPVRTSGGRVTAAVPGPGFGARFFEG